MPNRVGLGIGGLEAEPGDHICGVFSGERERDQVLIPFLASIHFSLDEDARWHRAWTTALLRYLIDDTPANAEVVSGWIGKWSPLASRALEAFAGTLADAPVPLDANAVTARITSDVSRDTDSVLKAGG